ncbi:Uncharacterized protein EJ110_NYTH56030 [Nymphaea thermarum]|nr:Uncharacterized protein EJ110_NYTH56030 [Nymphaea thermarum]
MPSPRPSRRDDKGNRAASFHGRIPSDARESSAVLRRPKTQPELFGSGRPESRPAEEFQCPPRPTKLLLNVTVQRSLGPIHIIISMESTVQDLIAATLRQYAKEGRRPILSLTDAAAFDLHYSQFSLERLNPEEKLIGLGSRNFFLCPKPLTATATTCSDEAEKAGTITSPWFLKFMDFLR